MIMTKVRDGMFWGIKFGGKDLHYMYMFVGKENIGELTQFMVMNRYNHTTFMYMFWLGNM